MARFLLAAGYSVLAFDLRAHGESEGDRFSLGQHERKDVAAAVDYRGARGFAPRRITLFGLSMGAGTALQSLALRPDVGPVIADSAYADGRVIVEEDARPSPGCPAGSRRESSWPRASYSGSTPPRAIRSPSCARLPTVRISSFNATLTTPSRRITPSSCTLPRRRASSGSPKAAVTCRHFVKHPDEYERRMLAFLEASMR